MLKKLTLETAQRKFLCAQIEIRVNGLGSEFDKLFHITWLHKNKMRAIKFLVDHLKTITKAEKKMYIPIKPPTYLSA